jgi:hypothetical protein
MDTIGALRVNSAFFISIANHNLGAKVIKKLEKIWKLPKYSVPLQRFSKQRFHPGSVFISNIIIQKNIQY